MQVTETLNSGLKREIKVTVPAGDMDGKLVARLNEIKDKVRINGFRPGKVPLQHLRKIYGKSFMAEVVNEILSNSDPPHHRRPRREGRDAARGHDDRGREGSREDPRRRAPTSSSSSTYEIIPAIEIKDVLRHQGHPPGL